MLTRIARHTFNAIVGDPDKRKAVALAIFVKDRKGASVWKDWSYRSIAKECGISPTTCKKRVATLVKLGMVDAFSMKGHNYLRFNKLRQGTILIKKKKEGEWVEKEFQPKTADVSLRLISHDSVKEIERGLMALVIFESTRRKEYVKQLITLAHDPKPFTNEKRVKAAREACKQRGYDASFVESGLSYRMIGRKLHCAYNTTKEVIAYGESLDMFEAQRRGWVLVEYVGKGCAKDSLLYKEDEKGRPVFATKSNIWYKPALLFSTTSTSRQSI